MIPYFTLPTWTLGGIPLDPWGLLVCGGFVLGLEIARARGIKLGLDVRDIVDASVFIVLSGFLGGHLVYVLAYHPDRFERDGIMSLVRVWEGFASTGGFVGAVTGAILFFRVFRKRPFWLHGDAIMFGFPFAWIFGRAGCFVVHDHIGRHTSFPLGVDFSRVRLPVKEEIVATLARTDLLDGHRWGRDPDGDPWVLGGVRHDLGLYETLVAVGIAALFLVLGRKPRAAGFFTMVWCLTYAPARFLMDFLRANDLRGADVRWAGLTPAQWVMLAMFTAGCVLWTRLKGAPVVGPEAAPEAAPETVPDSVISDDTKG